MTTDLPNALLKGAWMDESCAWTEDENGAWETACGKMFEFNVAGVGENGFKFCPYCGKPLADRRREEGSHD